MKIMQIVILIREKYLIGTISATLKCYLNHLLDLVKCLYYNTIEKTAISRLFNIRKTRQVKNLLFCQTMEDGVGVLEIFRLVFTGFFQFEVDYLLTIIFNIFPSCYFRYLS